MGKMIWYVNFDSIKVFKKSYLHIGGFFRSNIVFKAKFTWKRRTVTKHSYFWLYGSLSLHLINHLAYDSAQIAQTFVFHIYHTL